MSMERVKERVLNEEYTRRFETVAEHIPYAYQMGIELIELVKQQNEQIEELEELSEFHKAEWYMANDVIKHKDQRIEELEQVIKVVKKTVGTDLSGIRNASLNEIYVMLQKALNK